MTNLYARLLTPKGVFAARRGLERRYDWVTHTSRRGLFDLISANGVLPSDPYRALGLPVPDDIAAELTLAGLPDEVVCLHIVPRTMPWGFGKDDQLFTVAFPTSALPDWIGVDWSNPYHRVCCEQSGTSDPEDGFLEVVRRTESFVSYGPIPASALRIQLKNAGPLPSAWPSLVGVQADLVQWI
jgi:hypothetical protein